MGEEAPKRFQMGSSQPLAKRGFSRRLPKQQNDKDSKVLESAMKVTYDPEVDILNISLSNAVMEESDEDKPGVIIDYDKNGNVIGIEILDASKRMEDPRTMEYAVAS